MGCDAIQIIKQAEFTVALSCFKSKSLLNIADVLLPLASFAEAAGTRVNIMGEWQYSNAAITPWQESLPGWEIFNSLGELAGLAGFNYKSRDAILAELSASIATNQQAEFSASKLIASESQFVIPAPPHVIPAQAGIQALSSDSHGNDKALHLLWLADLAYYQADPLVRRAKYLQKLDGACKLVARVNSTVASNMELADNALIIVRANNGKSIKLPIEIDNSIPVGIILMEQGFKATAKLGCPYSYVTVSLV